jgi:dCMP deaminase
MAIPPRKVVKAATARRPSSASSTTATQAYYMRIADAVRQKASCDKRLVGAVVVLGNRIVSTGYNGTPEGMTNCNQGGCYRCGHPELYEPGKGYDVCICVHAEQNALLTAARFGISVEGADVYTTLAPCFGCMKELLQAKVRSVYYLGDFKVDAEHRDQSDALIARFRSQKGRVKKLAVPDVDPNLGRSGPETIEDTGHTMPAA